MDHAPSGNCSGLGAVGLKSLAPYRERRGRKFSHNGKKSRAAALSIGGDLKEVADSIRYGATIDSLCNEGFAGELMALREGNSALHWAATRPEDNTAPTAVAVGHFVQVLIWEALGGHPPVTPQGSERPIAVTEPTKNRSTSP